MNSDDLRSGFDDDSFDEDYSEENDFFDPDGGSVGGGDVAVARSGFTNAERAVIVLFGLFNLIALLAIVSIALGVFG